MRGFPDVLNLPYVSDVSRRSYRRRSFRKCSAAATFAVSFFLLCIASPAGAENPLLPKLAIDIELLGGSEFTLRSSDAASLLRTAVSSLSGLASATAAVYTVTTSHLTVDVSYITSGASIATLKELATAAAQVDTTSVDSDDRVLNGRDNTVPSSMWCPRLTLPVSGNVTMPLATVGLIITVPATYYASIGATTLEPMQEAAFVVQRRLSVAVGDTAVVATAFGSFQSAWAACTGLPPAAAEKAVAVVCESVAVVPGQPEVAALTSQALSPQVRAPPSTRMAVAISHPPQGFHVASGGSLSVSWTFPQGYCSSADKVSILLFSMAQSLNRVDSHGPPLTVSTVTLHLQVEAVLVVRRCCTSRSSSSSVNPMLPDQPASEVRPIFILTPFNPHPDVVAGTR